MWKIDMNKREEIQFAFFWFCSETKTAHGNTIVSLENQKLDDIK